MMGGHIRTDKLRVGAGCNTSDVTFGGTRRQRLLRGGGNVWQHLRSFRKRLFDSVPDDQLRLAAAAGCSVSQAADSRRSKASSITSVSASITTAAAHTVPMQLQQQQQKQHQQQQLQQLQQQLHGPGAPGYYYELANDWAFTVPMAELAVKPGVLSLPVYLYEPFWQRQDFAAREVVIGEGGVWTS